MATGDQVMTRPDTLPLGWVVSSSGRLSVASEPGHLPSQYPFATMDLIALATERRDLLRYDPATSSPWPILDTPGHEVQPYPRACLDKPAREQRQWHEWGDLFLREYAFLADEVQRVAREATHG